MTLKTQMTADLPAFFNTDEFADDATYTPQDGSAASAITAILELEATIEDRDWQTTRARTGIIRLQVSDIASPKQQDTVTIGTDTWVIQAILNGDDYTWSLGAVLHE